MINYDIQIIHTKDVLSIQGWSVSSEEIYKIIFTLSNVEIILPVIEARVDVYQAYKMRNDIPFKNKFFSGFQKKFHIRSNLVQKDKFITFDIRNINNITIAKKKIFFKKLNVLSVNNFIPKRKGLLYEFFFQ